jgi:hypothetical protein
MSANNPSALPESRHAELLARMSAVVARAESGEAADVEAIVHLVRDLRSRLTRTSSLHVGRTQAALNRRITMLFAQANQLVREFHYDGNVHHLTGLVARVREACDLSDRHDDSTDAEGHQPPESELLGNILIVGWW